jgi:uncharacterized membrane protein YgdD (TMEM256/DUF423 family)
MMKYQKYIFTGALLGALSVSAGAFGAHILENYLAAKQLDTYKLAVTYQFYHAIIIVVTAFLLKNNESNRLIPASLNCFLAGIVLFSGSLYLLSLREIIGIPLLVKIAGPLTPVGGIFLIAGWLLLAFSALKKEK